MQAPGPGSLPDCERPLLLALTASGGLMVYQAFNRGPAQVQACGGGGLHGLAHTPGSFQGELV